MELKTTNPKTTLLLGAGLDVLHHESKEWQETIALWKDEIKFFSTLLSRKEGTVSEFVNMLKNLDKIHESLFDYLAGDILNHEKLLARLIKSEKGLSDWDYRQQHGKLRERMELFAQGFREFKNMVFRYATKF